MRWASNLAFGLTGAMAPTVLGYGFGSFAVYHDWHLYVLTILMVTLGRVCRWEGTKA